MQLAKSRSPCRYAVLWHAAVDEPHFDFLVETSPGSDLATWRLPQWPIAGVVDAIRLRDHRRIFLDFEGSLSGDRGRVERVDGGACQLDIDQDQIWTVAGLKASTRIILQQVNGERWQFAEYSI